MSASGKIKHHPGYDGNVYSTVEAEIEAFRAANALTAVSADATFAAVNALLRAAGASRKAKDGSVYLDDNGNLIIGGTAAGASAVNVLVLINGTAPSANVSGIQLYALSGVAKLRDASGNIVSLDTHLLRDDTTATLTKGYVDTEKDLGTVTTGTTTPVPSDGNFQKMVNGGASTLAAPSASGSYSIVIDVTNNGSAGTLTMSGFTKQTGDALDTTNAHAFRLFITKGAAGTHLHVQAMQ